MDLMMARSDLGKMSFIQKLRLPVVQAANPSFSQRDSPRQLGIRLQIEEALLTVEQGREVVEEALVAEDQGLLARVVGDEKHTRRPKQVPVCVNLMRRPQMVHAGPSGEPAADSRRP
jgi:hypothetical protein